MSTETIEAPASTTETAPVDTEATQPINPLHSLFERINVPETAEPPKPPTEVKPKVEPTPETKTPADPKVDAKAPVDNKGTQAEVSTEEVDKFIKELSPKANKRFLDFANQRAEKLAAERAEKIVAEKLKGVNVEESAKIKTEYESLLKRNQEVEKTLREVDLTRTREFRERFTEPLQKIDTQISGLAKEFEIDGDRLKHLLEAPLNKANAKALEELTEELPGVAKQLVAQVGLQLRGLNEQKQAVMADADAAYKAIEAQRKEHFETLNKRVGEERSKVFDGMLPELKKSTPVLFEGEHAQESEKLVGQVKEALNQPLDILPANVRNHLIYTAVMGKRAISVLGDMQKQVTDLNAKLATANETITKYRGASPDLESGGGADDRNPKAEPKSLFQRITER